MFSPKDVIKKSYLKQKLLESEFNNFKQSLSSFLNDIKDNDEEFNKTLLKELLEKSIGYSSYKINTKDKIDLAIYIDSTPEIIIELKAPKNKSEMITIDNLNIKALHETLLYYLREKHKNKNFNLKHIVITDSIEWFVFDAVEFNKISTNKKIEKIYKNKEIYETLFSANNDEFYKIVEDILKDKTILQNIKYVRFYLKDKQTDTQLKNIYKLLSPTHLLKLYNDNDSNSLNKNFYYELLHILGLEEIKDGAKKIIARKSVLNREDGSLLENTILKLSTTHGVEGENELFEIALELNITWLNRILFLKLLEARLLNIHKGKYPKFLSYNIVDEFDKLDTLFFEVLAKKIGNRPSVKIEQFKNIPYLNSSLFEPTELEKKYLLISNLKDNLLLNKYSKTVLRNETKELKSIEYLLKFLNAYDFGSDDISEFKKEHATLINSSVLGLIFEKLNGYKDGSFFTPAFITMYMSKQSIRKTVVDKFNQEFNWDCKTIDDIYNKNYDLNKANELLNSVTICDPAVGSGHFLVSGLNELLSIKSELGMLIDENGKRLKNIKLIAEDDEIYILDEDGEFFNYKINEGFKVSNDVLRIQKTIFNEKLHIIENQLFGVDININSVKITQLRLWIELLKDSYYDENNELVTLPNIDINIKCGNSLISKYPLLDSDTKNKILKDKLDEYKKYVKWYKETNDKDIKKEVVSKIDEIKRSFSQKLQDGSPQINELKKLLNGDKAKGYIEQYGFKGLNDDLVIGYAKQSYCLLYARFGKEYNPSDSSLFGDEIKLLAKEKKENKAKQEKELKNILKKYEIIKDFEDAKIYANSFEWRFEFPEVLNEEGDYVGFDIVIGNPPYGASLDEKTKEFYKDKYENVHMRTIDTFNYFISMSSTLLTNKGVLSFIVPNNLLYQNEYEKTRELLFKQYTLLEAINLGDNIFEDVNVPTCIVEYQNIKTKDNYSFRYSDIRDSQEKQKEFESLITHYYDKESLLKVPSYTFGVNPTTVSLIEKVKEKSYLIDDIASEVASGISTGGDKIFRVSHDFIDENKLEKDILHKVLVGREINKYEINYTNHKVIYSTRDTKIFKYPNILNYLEPFKDKLMQRSESKQGILPWSSLNRQRYIELFAEDKILLRQTADSVIATFDENGYFSLDSTLIFKIDAQFDIEYKFAIAILNSKLTTCIYKNYTGEDGRAFAQVKPKNIRKLYILKVEKEIQNEFVKIVDRIVELKKNAKNTSKLECLIDKKVYALYDLNSEEIAMVEKYDKN